MPSMMAQVIDSLITDIQAMQVAWPSTVPAPDFGIFDGYNGPFEPEVVVTVGGQPAPTATGKQTWAGLGAKRKWEDFTVQINISAILGGAGDTPETVSDAQKTTRDLVTSVGHAIEAFLIADPTLGGLLSTLGGWASVDTSQLRQTDDHTAAQGRDAAWVIDVAVKARI